MSLWIMYGKPILYKKMRMILKNLTFRTRTKNNGLEINEKIYFNQITINDFIQLFFIHGARIFTIIFMVQVINNDPLSLFDGQIFSQRPCTLFFFNANCKLDIVVSKQVVAWLELVVHQSIVDKPEWFRPNFQIGGTWHAVWVPVKHLEWYWRDVSWDSGARC